MSVHNWTDYHAWRVSADDMFAARLLLTDAGAAALNVLAEADGSYIVPREVIETFALAMPAPQACTWLESVYHLQPGDGSGVRRAIKDIWSRKP